MLVNASVLTPFLRRADAAAFTASRLPPTTMLRTLRKHGSLGFGVSG
jgi:hypothetical protein